MFGRSLMKDFEDDPFFSGFGSHRDMFESMGRFHDPFMAISDRREENKQAPKNSARDNQLADPFSGFFQSMNSMMSGMHRHMADLQAKADSGDPNMHSFSSSTVMSYSNDGKSEPKYYQASSSTRRAPGNIKETRRTLRDSQTGIDKMAVSHHIGDKGRVIERRRNKKAGGAIEEERNYIQMGEDEEKEFDKEWRKRTTSYNMDYGRPSRGLMPPKEAMPHASEGNRRVKGTPAAAARGLEAPRPHGPSKSGRARSKY